MAIQTVQALVNGQTYTLTLNSETGKYEAMVTAPSASSFIQPNGYYPVSVLAKDTAGNSTSIDTSNSSLGEKLKLYVKEKVKPVITILEPSNDSYVTTSTPTIKFKVLDNVSQTTGYSGVNKDSIILKINGSQVLKSKINWTETEGGFIGVYTPDVDLDNGSTTIIIDCADNDGNFADSASSMFTIDTLAPSLVVEAPIDGFETNNSELTVKGVTDDVTSKPVIVNIKLNGVNQGSVTVGEDGSFSKTITLSEKGTNTIIVTATDRAGKETSVTRSVVYNTTAPNITDVSIAPNPVDAGKTYIISVSVISF